MDASQNNSFGSLTNGGIGSEVPIVSSGSTGGGDIILAGNRIAGGDSKKKRMALVLGAFGIVAILVGVTVAVIILGSDDKDLKKGFNRYANYLLYGEESGSDIDGEYVYGDNYYLSVAKNNNKTEEYFQTTREKFDKLVQIYEKIKADSGDDATDAYVLPGNDSATPVSLSEELSNNQYNLGFFALLNEYPVLKDDELISVALSESLQDAYQSIQNYYTPFLESGLAIAVKYANEEMSILYKAADAIRFFNDKGCIVESDGKRSIDSSCTHSSEDYKEQREKINAYYQNQISNASLAQVYSSYVYSGVWDLKEIIYAQENN